MLIFLGLNENEKNKKKKNMVKPCETSGRGLINVNSVPNNTGPPAKDRENMCGWTDMGPSCSYWLQVALALLSIPVVFVFFSFVFQIRPLLTEIQLFL